MTGKERAYLRSLAQKMDPVIYVGKEGITEALVNDTNMALTARELVKGSVGRNSDEDVRDVIEELCDILDAEPIQVIGRKFVIYRKKEEDSKYGI